MNDNDICLISSVNNDDIFKSCLARSPDVVSGRLKLTIIRNSVSMSEAYNRALDQTENRYAVLAHQDVYLPQGWLDLAKAKLTALDRSHPDWMVAGPYGVQADGRHVGRVWDVGLDRELGAAGFPPTPIVSLDELLLVLRRDNPFRFDPDLPHFHLYGTDLVQSALCTGRSAWALEMPVVHNSQLVASLSGGYTLAYRYACRKWKQRLPIPTTVVPVTRNPIPLLFAKWRLRNRPERAGKLLADAVAIARRAGYE
ncbi:MAG: hypothetical protein CVT75_08210 [Alphaproteobacteria bacterium HGW-Alphaproteobacteria-14]|nr:MAG: hypothetical protein CVT75_08210 [Alphaproteobacteria bacterium HGW-Alphaproteobacteria-14]